MNEFRSLMSKKKDNVAKSGIDPRGVGLSQTDSDKKLRSYI